LKLHDYNQMMGYMKRRAFANGSPEPTTTFNDKIETLKEASPGLMPRSRVAILKGYMDEALKDGEITQEQHTQMLMPYFGEVGEKVTEQIAVSDRENFAIGGGNFYGTDLGTREGFAGVKQFTSGKNKDKYYVRYRDKEFGKRKSGTGFNEGNKIFDTKEEADVFYNERQANLGKLKSSGQKTKILNQTEQINNFVNNFFDNNINEYSVRDYDKFEKDLIKEFKKVKTSSLGEKGRNILRHGLPNIGAKDSNIPFEKYNSGVYLSQGNNPEQAYKNFFKKLFYSGKMETDSILRKRVGEYLDYYNVDKKFYGDGSPINREGLKVQYADTLDNLRDVMFILGDDKVGTGKFRSNIIKNYFPDSMDKYINKRNRSSIIYDQKLKQIENKLTPEQLKKVLGGETSIKNFMTKQSDLLKDIFDVSTLDPGLKFNLDHTEGIAEIAKMDNSRDIMRGLNNLVGMTSSRNYELGWRGYSTKRKALLNNIDQGIDVDKNLQELNDLTKSVYPEVKGKDAYKIVNNKITPTKDFNFTYEPEKAFRQYFTELTTSPQSLKVLQSQYEKNPNFKEFIQKDPNLTSAIDNTYNKMIDVLKNPKFKNVLQNSGLTLRGLGQMRKGNIPGFLNTMEKLVQKNPDFRVELGDPYKDIENQLASASMMSDVSPVKKETEEPGLPAEAIGAGTLFGMKYAPQIARGVGNTVRAVGSPLAGLTLAGTELLSDDPNLGQAGAELLLPEQVRRIAGKLPKGIMSNFFGLQGLSKFGKLGALAARAPSVMTPVGLTMLGAEGIKKLYDEEQKKNRMIEAMDPEERLQFLQEEKDTEELISRSSAAYGGRMGFADGPEDPKKRKFMKIMGGLASIPLLGRFIDIGTQAPKVAEVVRRGADGVPEFLMDLIAKVKLKAKTKGMEYFTGNKPEEFKDVYQVDNYVVTEKGNKTIIREIDQDGDMLYKENQMELDYDPETGGYTYNEASARPDAEGKLKDVEEYIEEDDLENMRKYTYDE